MRIGNRVCPAVLLALAASTAGAGFANAATASGTDRLFLSFAEDASLANRQWWEGQFQYDDGSDDLPWDRTIVRGVVAINLTQRLELGGRVGFGSTSAPDGIPDGSGATDLDVWGKWVFPTRQNTAFAAGVIATVPTGDETSGLGYDSFSAKAFGSLRYQLPNAVFTANVGLRMNQDGRIGDPNGPGFNARADGKTSASFGAGIVIPVSQQVTLVGEVGVESERFDGPGFDSDTRILGGVNWSPTGRGYDGVCTLAVYEDAVKLFFAGGAGLAKADPNRLLQGKGKLARYVAVSAAADLDRPEIVALMAAALALAKVRLVPGAKGAVIVKAEEQRERAVRAKKAARPAAAKPRAKARR